MESLLKTETKSWNVELRFGEAGLARLTRALVKCRGWFTDSFVYSSSYSEERRAPVMFRIHLPVGRETEFEKLARITLQEKPVYVIQEVPKDWVEGEVVE